MTKRPIRINKAISEEKPVLDTHSSYNLRNMPVFDLSMIYLSNYTVRDVEDDSYSTSLHSLPAFKYENMRKIQYYYNTYRAKLIDAKSNYRSKQHLCKVQLLFLEALATPLFINNKVGVNPIIKDLEKNLSNNLYINELMKRHFVVHGYIQIQMEKILLDKPTLGLISDAVDACLLKIADWLTKTQSVRLKQAFYTTNLHRSLTLLNVNDEPIRAFAEYLLYCKTNDFSELHRYTSIDNVGTAIGYTSKELENVSKFIGVVFERCNTSSDTTRLNTGSATVRLCGYVSSGCLTVFESEKELNTYYLPESMPTKLTLKDFDHVEQATYIVDLLKAALKTEKQGINILLYGKPGTGKTQLAKVIMQAASNNCYEVASYLTYTNHNDDLFGNSGKEYSNYHRIINYNISTTILEKAKNAVLLYDEAEDFFRKANDASQSKAAMNMVLEKNHTPTLWTTNSTFCMEESFLRRFSYTLNIDDLPEEVYIRVVNEIAKKFKISLPEETFELCKYHKPNLGTVETAISNYALTGKIDATALKNNIIDALKCQLGVMELPDVVTNKFTFNPELVNSSEDLITLKNAICNNKRLDFSLLLYGIPGSSKTSFAKYLAEELGLRVIHKTYVELSSMWVGATEKNISEMFAKARRDKALIILDECDVLLQDRQRSQRSWEVSQTEALLTEMEKHELPFVMTTNLYDNLDAAVMRRILYKVKHDYLTEKQIHLAFKHFFNINLRVSPKLSKLSAGDFAVVKKKAEFMDKLSDEKWIIENLESEMNQKKLDYGSATISV